MQIVAEFSEKYFVFSSFSLSSLKRYSQFQLKRTAQMGVFTLYTLTPEYFWRSPLSNFSHWAKGRTLKKRGEAVKQNQLH